MVAVAVAVAVAVSVAARAVVVADSNGQSWKIGFSSVQVIGPARAAQMPFHLP